VLVAVSVLSFVAPTAAAGQESGRFSVQGAFGSHLNAGGNTESVSLGFWPGARIGILVSGERTHVPTVVTRSDHGFGATRGGTAMFISGELRVSFFASRRVSPYGFGGAGRGTSRPNVNDIFPGPVPTGGAAALFGGGGVRVAIAGHLSTFVDMRFLLQVENTEGDVLLLLPVRVGLAWRF